MLTYAEKSHFGRKITIYTDHVLSPPILHYIFFITIRIDLWGGIYMPASVLDSLEDEQVPKTRFFGLKATYLCSSNSYMSFDSK